MHERNDTTIQKRNTVNLEHNDNDMRNSSM